MWKRPAIAKNNRILTILGCISAVILAGYILNDNLRPKEPDFEKDLAAMYMGEMIEAVSTYCYDNSIQIDLGADPMETGLIGLEWTEMTTTIGHLDAKRTSLNTEFASLMVDLLREANLEAGDKIALGCSGSFPGLLLASLSSAKAMNLDCKSIISLGASSYGANRPDLTILDIYQILINKGLVKNLPVGISLGGEFDMGVEWDREIHDMLLEKIQMSGIPFIWHEHLKDNVKQRADLYGFNTAQSPKAFINAGGATANIGTSTSILHLKPGLITKAKIPPAEEQGMLHFSLKKGIPVIHLLFIKGLANKYGLVWDPVDL